MTVDSIKIIIHFMLATLKLAIMAHDHLYTLAGMYTCMIIRVINYTIFMGGANIDHAHSHARDVISFEIIGTAAGQ